MERASDASMDSRKEKMEVVARAFGQRPKTHRKGGGEGNSLVKQIEDAVARTPEYLDLFTSMARHVLDREAALASTTATAAPNSNGSHLPSRKRRRDELEDGAEDESPENNGSLVAVPREGEERVIFDLQTELSFSVPVRKKLKLEFTSSEIRGRSSASGNVECRVAFQDIEQIICVPVPEKPARQLNFCLFPCYSNGVSPVPEDTGVKDPLVWTIPDVPSKDIDWTKIGNETATDSFKTFLVDLINKQLPKGTRVVEPDEKGFASALIQAHRKGEKAVHIKAFRGSKEGYLFLLPTGILWAFKKPLLFFPFSEIASISYTSVLQRTFNLNITTNGPPSQDLEFAMIDQADYPGIDGYVKAHSLQDASMAEQRKAKRLNINPPAGGAAGRADGETGDAAGAGNADADGEEEGGEIDKAVREMEQKEVDEEDEEEEDYDPGSEGESEGEGSSSGDEEEEADDGEGSQEGVEDDEGLDEDEIGEE